jgi:hypothetical protein
VSQPRFLIVHGRVQQGVSVPEWPTGEDPFAVRDRPDGHWFSWRMLGGNNRELGRGATVHSTEVGCLAAMSRAQVDAARSTSFIGLQATGLWWWQLELGGAPVAVAGRSYRRQRECRYNLDQFLLTWSSAVVPAPSDRVVEDRLSAGSVVPLRGTRPLPGPGGIDFKGPNRLRVAR